MSIALPLGSLFIAGFWLCRVLAQRTGDPFLVGTVAAAYGLRAGLAAGLYAISRWALPIGSSLQLGEGFWAFAPDAVFFHRYATAASMARAAGLALPPASTNGDPGYPLVVAAIYTLCGSHPLYAIWLNVLLGSLTVLLVYLLTRRLGGAKAARAAAVCVAVWPSSLLWATQLLKDTAEAFLIVAFMWTLHRAAATATDSSARTTATKFAYPAAALIVLVAAIRLRLYVGLALLVSGSTVLAAMAVAAAWRQQYSRAVQNCAIAALLVCAVGASTWLPAEPSSTINTQAGLDRLARQLASSGDTANAEWLKLAFSVERIHETALAQARVDDEGGQPMTRVFGYLSLSYLAEVRRGFFVQYSNGAAGTGAVSSARLDFVRFAPRALANTFLSPNPWTNFDPGSLPRLVRVTAMCETLLLAILLVLSARGFRDAIEAAWPPTLLITVFSLLMAIVLGFAIPEVGALFRMRLAIVSPLCVLAGIGLTRHRART